VQARYCGFEPILKRLVAGNGKVFPRGPGMDVLGLARRLPVWSIVALAVAMELFAGYMIHDGCVDRGAAARVT
jgi:hypothetical protein